MVIASVVAGAEVAAVVALASGLAVVAGVLELLQAAVVTARVIPAMVKGKA
ncbi:MAG TPA: hypothetical protein VES01_11065 [Dermatophilaceae bacterium]|nr:hypothetical protein [Dermatophilaceae bacterium]